MVEAHCGGGHLIPPSEQAKRWKEGPTPQCPPATWQSNQVDAMPTSLPSTMTVEIREENSVARDASSQIEEERASGTSEHTKEEVKTWEFNVTPRSGKKYQFTVNDSIRIKDIHDAIPSPRKGSLRLLQYVCV